jgi:hypothetical protein
MIRETPSFQKQKFLYRLSRSEYEKDWGKDYTKPGFGTRLLAFLLRFVPKIGPFKALAFNNPTPQTEQMYFKSINETVDRYKALLEAERAGSLVLVNSDLDTGNPTKAAEYSLTDDTYAKLLSQLMDRKFDLTSVGLQENILLFYSDLSAPFDTKKDSGDWQNVLKSLDQLKSITPKPSDSPAEASPSESRAKVAAPADTQLDASTPPAK